MPNYIATFRATYEADDDVSAILIADKIRDNGAKDLNDGEDADEPFDTFYVSQVTSNIIEVTPDELLTQLRKTRNLLIKTRIKQCFEEAKALDQIIYALAHKDESGFTMSGYSHGDFMDLVELILSKGVVPDV